MSNRQLFSLGTHKNDSGVLSDRGSEEKEEWQDLQKLYGSAPNKIDPNGNSNNNCTALSTLPEKSSSSIPSPVCTIWQLLEYQFLWIQIFWPVFWPVNLEHGSYCIG